MKRKLLSMPLPKAYIITTLLATAPACIFGVYFYRLLGAAKQDAASLESAVDSGNAIIKAGAFDPLAATHSVWFWLAGVTLSFLFAGGFIRAMMGNVTLETVDQMIVDMRSAATGDLRVDPTITMQNEYGELQHEFARLVTNARTTITQVDRAALDLREASREMSHTSAEAGNAIGEVAQAISAISQGATHQVDLVGRSADHIDSIDHAVRDAFEHAEQVKRQSIEAAALADSGVARAADVEEAMQTTRDAVHDTAQSVRELGERSAGIHVIVQSIADIAAQTNMLALNASIEAARAGEQGRGFANVADEVRVLAEDAGSAVARIGEVINEISQQTAGALEATEEGIARVEDSSETLGRNRQTFVDIGAAIHELGARSAEISDLTAEVVESAGRARQHVAEVAIVAEQSSASTEEVSASTQETSAASEEVSASAQKVADTSATLAELSGRFKLPSRDAA